MASSPETAPPGDNVDPPPPPSDQNENAEPPPSDDNGSTQSPPSDDGNAGSPPDDGGNNVDLPPGDSVGVSPPPDSSSSPPQPQAPPGSPPSSTPSNPITSPSAENLPPPDNLPLPSSPTVGQSPPNDAGSSSTLPNPDDPPTSDPLTTPVPGLILPSGNSSQTLPSPNLSNDPPGPGSSIGSSTANHNSIKSSGSNVEAPVIAGIVCGGVVIILLLLGLLMLSRRKKKEQFGTNSYQPPKGMERVINLPPAGSLEAPVNGWGMPTGYHSSGEFGCNNSGQHPLSLQSPSPYGSKSQFSFEELSTDGREVAVKSLKPGSGQGEREFQAEVEIISRVHHRHLVSLVGYCIEWKYGCRSRPFSASYGLGLQASHCCWVSQRASLPFKLSYSTLGDPRIIHRDIKAANILIDLHFEAKARPLMSQAMETGDYSKLADARLEHKYNQQEMAHLVACANACVRHSARKRPRMSQVVRALEGDSSFEDLNGDAKLGQGGGSMRTRTNRDIYDTQAYNADIVQFRKMIQPTQEFDSTSYS